MERQLAERMIGAAVLLAALVIIVPSIFDSGEPGPVAADPAEADGAVDMRTHTIHLEGAQRMPPVARPREEAAAPPEAPPPAAAAPTPAHVESSPPAAAPSTVTAGPAPGASAATPPAPARGEPETSPAPSPPAARADQPSRVSATPSQAAGPASGAASGPWAVQLGVFSKRENADRLVADLGRKGFSARVVSARGSSGAVYKVLAGPAPTREAATSLAERLAAAGHRGQVTHP